MGLGWAIGGRMRAHAGGTMHAASKQAMKACCSGVRTIVPSRGSDAPPAIVVTRSQMVIVSRGLGVAFRVTACGVFSDSVASPAACAAASAAPARRREGGRGAAGVRQPLASDAWGAKHCIQAPGRARGGLQCAGGTRRMSFPYCCSDSPVSTSASARACRQCAAFMPPLPHRSRWLAGELALLPS